MAKKETTIKDFSHKNKLSILINQDGLYFCVYNPKQGILQLSSKDFDHPQTPENLLKELQFLLTNSLQEEYQNTLGKLRVYYGHALYAIIPQRYFKEEEISNYLKFNIKLLPTDEITYDYIAPLKAQFAYIPYTNINNYLFEQFGSFEFEHFLPHFLSMPKPKYSSAEQVYLNVFPLHFDLVVFKDNTLLMANSYTYFTAEDFIYYLLFALRQLNLDFKKLSLSIYGSLTEEKEIHSILGSYIKNIHHPNPKISLSIHRLEEKEVRKHNCFLSILS